MAACVRIVVPLLCTSSFIKERDIKRFFCLFPSVSLSHFPSHNVSQVFSLIFSTKPSRKHHCDPLPPPLFVGQTDVLFIASLIFGLWPHSGETEIFSLWRPKAWAGVFFVSCWGTVSVCFCASAGVSLHTPVHQGAKQGHTETLSLSTRQLLSRWLMKTSSVLLWTGGRRRSVITVHVAGGWHPCSTWWVFLRWNLKLVLFGCHSRFIFPPPFGPCRIFPVPSY